MPADKRKVFVLSGKRGGFGAMIPTLEQIVADPALELQLVVTDQHLSSRFGRTISEVEQYFSVAGAVDMEQASDSPADRTRALGRCLSRMTDVLQELDPDLVALYGDRGEALVSGIAAINLGKPVVHMQGGDLSGNLDESMRHALTKLSHVHLVSTEESGARVRGLGEEDWRVHVVGDLHVDMIVGGRYAEAGEVAELFELDLERPVLVVLQHPDTLRPEDSYEHMTATLQAVAATGHQTVLVYPCSDQGYEGILQAIDEHRHLEQIQIHKNIPAHRFWGLLAVSSAMIGNSSAGLIETPYLKLPALNIGARQLGRLHAENVIHLDHDAEQISQAIQRALHDEQFQQTVASCSLPYGDGHSYRRVVKVLKELVIDDKLLSKRMTY